MIDIWLLCGLTIPFLVFILEVTSEMIRHNKKQQNKARANFISGLSNMMPTKVQDSTFSQNQSPYHQQENHNSISMVGTTEANGTNNEGNHTCSKSVFKVNRGTQADKKGNKKPEILVAAKNRDIEIKFTFLEEMVLTYKKVTIPLMTTLFIFGYMVAAVRNYVY